MKFAISFLFSASAFSAPINIFHEGLLNDAEIYKNILINEYYIPEELILVRGIQDCKDAKEMGQIDLCLKNNGDLRLVSADYEFINESLKVFQSP
jgi:hypothetical protein